MYDYMDAEFWTEAFVSAKARVAPPAIPVRKPPTREELRLLRQVLAERKEPQHEPTS